MGHRNKSSMKYTLLVLILVVAACTKTPERYDVYGEPAFAPAAIAVEAVLADSTLYTGKVVTLAGTVHAVCQMKGCWLTLQSLDGQSVRVDVARTDDGDYAFTVPKDISGRHAIARGILQKAHTDAATQHHYDEDAGGTMLPSKLSMVADGVMIAPQ